ncbi:helix-turn-helix domain-containing protein [Cohnella sp. REN36]|uniref:response regulator transcription factor n=1 Tax=Cohnella sp. REN36 TaxID=2887347 RepID=UPI001D15A2B8|nr:helix-turn-helix domain-containing protein [Cohnella sp. REN36]
MLHVDSDAQSREATERLIDWARLGFEIRARASHGAEARTLFDKLNFSLVLINMKRLQSDGLQLCEQIRQTSRVPILLLGGSADFALVRQALIHQASDYLAEPVQSFHLTASLRNVRRELAGRTAPDRPIPAESSKERSTQPSVVEIVMNYVQAEMHRNITLKKISDALHFNCAYLGRKFKNEENMTFNEYLLQQRMEKAKRLLEQTDMRIYEIANEVGYSELDWFYKRFKEYTGISANMYRKQLVPS